MKGNCVLCGRPLNNGMKVNREHYVPATCIRNFDKLGIPKHFDHALRIDLRPDGGGDITLAPRSAHKEWATVLTHEKCNTDASHMCRDMKYIIDNPHNYPDYKEESIIRYYAHIWNLNPEQVEFENVSDKEVDDAYDRAGGVMIYCPGYFWVGKLYVGEVDMECVRNDYEQHTIIIGTKKVLESIIDEFLSTGKIKVGDLV